jgi:hypothetical protein
MIRLNFDFERNIKDLANLQIAMKENLKRDIEILKAKAGKPLTTVPIPKDLIKWADNIFITGLSNDDMSTARNEGARILKYLTLSPALGDYISSAKNRTYLISLIKENTRERTLSNILLHYFKNFHSIEPEHLKEFKNIFIDYFDKHQPRLAITQFYINCNLNLLANRSTVINKVIGKIGINSILGDGLPTELKATVFYKELIISISSRLYDQSRPIKEKFWKALMRSESRDLKVICISRVVLKVIGDTDKDFCKRMAMKYIGDPSIKQKWIVENKYNRYQQEVEKARLIVEVWINQQFISAFFETMAASNRGAFWLNYVNHMKGVKILGSPYFLANMKRKFPSASEYLEGDRFKQCGYSSEACVFMEFDSHIIILFDTEGKAGICRSKEDSNLPAFKYYGNVTSIIDGQFHKAYRVNGNQIYDIKQGGRLFHSHDWEEDFKVYLRTIVL